MGWFSPVKGHMLSLGQVDKTLPLTGNGVTAVERGTILALTKHNTTGEALFKVAGANDNVLYVALQDYTDPTAGFAGNKFDTTGSGQPAITGIDLSQDGEYETSVFKDETFAVGDALYVGAGGLLTKTQANGSTGPVVGYVTAARKSRWVNNAIALPQGETDRRLAQRTGAQLEVIRFKVA